MPDSEPDIETKTMAETRSPRRRLPTRATLRIFLLLLGPVLVLLGAFYFYAVGGRYAGTDNAYVKAPMVTVSPEIAGRVTDVLVTENQTVKEGDVLFRLDAARLVIARDEAAAHLDSVRNDVSALKASYRQRQADLAAANETLGLAQREFERRQKLIEGKIISESEFDEARNRYDVAKNEVAAIEQDLQRLLSELNNDPEIDPADHPLVRAAAAGLAQAELDLSHATVTAPIAGIVSRIDDVRPGLYLTAGEPTFALVSIDELWVEANLKETDLTWVQPGQIATITVDTYPGREWRAEVASIGAATGSEFSVLPAQNATGNWVKVVQRIPVRLVIAGADDAPNAPTLRAGMSVEVEIDTNHHRWLPGGRHCALAGIGIGQ